MKNTEMENHIHVHVNPLLTMTIVLATTKNAEEIFDSILHKHHVYN